jgi:hypothetical protein
VHRVVLAMSKVDKASRQARAARKLAAKQLELRKLFDEADAEKSANRRSLALSLSRNPSEFEKLCDELGGPADIGVKFNKRDMNRYCKDYPSRRIVPILRQFTSDESSARRLWPWAAIAISLYDSETREHKTYLDELSGSDPWIKEPSPNEVAEMLLQIEDSARNLNSGLCHLQALSYRLKDPTAPLRRAHLAWLDAYVSQAAAGIPSNDVHEDGAHQLAVDSAKQAFLARLAMVAEAAKVAQQRLDTSRRKNSGPNPLDSVAGRRGTCKSGRFWA